MSLLDPTPAPEDPERLVLEVDQADARIHRRLRDDPGYRAIQEIAGSLYVGTGWLPGAVNATVGAAVMGLAALRVRSRLPAIALLALATYGLPLLSPLLSAQMLLWPTLFVALLATAPHRLAAATGVITTALLVWWQPAASWWAAVTVLRNGLLIATVLLIARPRSSDEGQPKISRKNLPV